MSTWTAQTIVNGLPQDVLDVLTDPAAVGRWAPVDFVVEGLEGDRLIAGSRARVVGRLAGRRVGFDVEVHRADEQQLELVATGPVSFDVNYRLRPIDGGSEVEACVAVRRGRGLVGRVVASATDALLAAGALNQAVSRIAREFEPAPLATC